MALNTFKIKEIQIGKLPPIGWTEHQLRQVGETASEVMKGRIATGVNRFGVAMDPLAKSYRKRKTRKGKSGIRDMNFSGNMMGSMGVTESSDSHVAISFRGATPRMKARFRQGQDAFFGFGALESVAVDERLQHFLSLNVRRFSRR